MDGEADILQHRVEVPALGRRRIEPQERVRGEDDEGEERGGDQALHGEHAGLQSRRQTIAEQRHERAEDREDERPEQHRALVITPDAGDFEDERHGGMGILGDCGDGEVGDDIGRRQHREGDRDKGRHCEHQGSRERHHRPVAAGAPGERRSRQQGRQRERKQKGEEAGFGDHCASSPRHTPWRFSASTASRGM